MNLNRAYVYILSNKSRTVLYIGVTNNLESRVKEHIIGVGSAFTSKYKTSELVYYEIHNSIVKAIKREKQLKEWKRAWKIDLIKTTNPDLKNLAEGWDGRSRVE